MIYQFAQIYYLLLVKKVVVTNATGYRKVARNAKLVFDAYEPAEGGSGSRRDEGRIAQNIYQVFTEGHWHTVEVNDRSFLEAFGLMPDMNPSVDLEAELTGRWITGLPGPPGPDGYNPLLEFQVIEPLTADVLDATTIEPLIRKPNVRGPEGYRPIHQSIKDSESDYSDFFMAIEGLSDRIVERIQPLIASGVSSPGSDMSQRPSRAAEMAYRAYRLAEENLGARISDKKAYEWLRENGPVAYTLPLFETWARYLRQGRQHYGEQKNQPRMGRAGRSIVHPSEI